MAGWCDRLKAGLTAVAIFITSGLLAARHFVGVWT
jgi:hypothetical protein